MWSKILRTGLLERLKGRETNSQTTDPSQQAAHEALKYFKRKGQMELWTGIEGMRQMKFDRQQHEHNRKAEEGHVREKVWGYKNKSSDDDMGDFVNFGDIQQPQRSTGWVAMLLTALCTLVLCVCLLLGVAGAAAIYAVMSSDGASTMMDETVKLGLGRLDDYTQPESEPD